MNLPKTIIVETEDGEYIIAQFKSDVETPDEEYIPVYKFFYHCHDLPMAIRNLP